MSRIVRPKQPIGTQHLDIKRHGSAPNMIELPEFNHIGGRAMTDPVVPLDETAPVRRAQRTNPTRPSKIL